MEIDTNQLKENLKLLKEALGKTDYENKFYFQNNAIYAISGKLFIKIGFEHNSTFAVDGKSFTAFINKIKTKEVELVVGETNILVRTKKSRSEFPLYKDEQAIPTEIFDNQMQQAPIDLAEAITTVAYASSRNKSRAHLCGVMLRGNEATGTDGRQISVSSFDGEIDGEIIIPSSVVKYIKNLGIANYGYVDNWFIFKTEGGVEFACPTLEGNYPSKEKIDGFLDVNVDKNIKFPAKETIEALDTCSVFLDGVDDLDKLVLVEVKNGKAMLTTKSLHGKHRERMAVEFDGEVTFGVNPNFFKAILNKTDSVGIEDGRMVFESDQNKCVIALATI